MERFVLEVRRSDGWEEIVRGTTVGYKRLLRFPRQAARDLRLRILQGRGKTEIASFGLYLAAPGEP